MKLSVKQFPSAENGSPKQRPIFGIWFSNLIFLRFFFRLRSPLPSTILGHWELTRALDAFDFVVLRSCAGLRCLTPLVFLKLGIARHVGCALSAPNCEDRCGKSSTSCGDWSLCGKLQLKYWESCARKFKARDKQERKMSAKRMPKECQCHSFFLKTENVWQYEQHLAETTIVSRTT